MFQGEIQKLKYRRQYIITPETVECPFFFKKVAITTEYTLWCHIDLNVCHYSENNSKLIIIGDIFDYSGDLKNNQEIAKSLFDSDFKVILRKIFRYTGRYVVIFSGNNDLYLCTDTTASRKIFYADINRKFWAASQPHLLAGVLRLDPTKDPSKYAYYHSKDFLRLYNSNIGNTTYYDEIFQVIPNHCLVKKQGSESKVVRYWPDSAIVRKNVDDIVPVCSEIIKGYMTNILSRYEVMLPLTAGKDSRILLAASLEFRERIYYYVNKINGDDHVDITVPKAVADAIGLDFNVLEPKPGIDSGFRQVYFENNPFASERALPLIYNYYINFSDRVNLPGNTGSAGIEHYHNMVKKNVRPADLANMAGVNKYKFACDVFEKWHSETKEACYNSGLELKSLLYWEHRLTNGIYQMQMDKDIAQEEVNPFNSREFVSNILSAEKKYLMSPNYILHKKILGNIYAPAMLLPLNPSFKNRVLGMLNSTRISYPLYYTKTFLNDHFFRKSIND
jgi:hypothetical protein